MKFSAAVILLLSLAASSLAFPFPGFLRFKRQSYLPLQAVLEGKPPKFVDGLNQGGLGPDPIYNPQGGLCENGVCPPPQPITFPPGGFTFPTLAPLPPLAPLPNPFAGRR